MKRWKYPALAVLFSLFLTAVLQVFVGDLTIYSADLQDSRIRWHWAIVLKFFKDGRTWNEQGANNFLLRPGIVYPAHWLHTEFGLSLTEIYRQFDNFFLFASFLAWMFYLRKWFGRRTVVLATLFLAFNTILTYHYHVFHPWDRPSFLLWILLLYLIREKKPLALFPLFFLAMIIKFDVSSLPLLYALAHYRKSDPDRAIAWTAALFVFNFVVLSGLRYLFPNAGAPVDMAFLEMVFGLNLKLIGEAKFAHPFFLAHIVPFALICCSPPRQDRFIQASTLMALIVLLPHLPFTRLVEVRAQWPVLLLAAPAALKALENVLPDEATG